MVRIGKEYEMGDFGHNERMEYRQARLAIVNTWRAEKEKKVMKIEGEIKDLNKEIKEINRKRKMILLELISRLAFVAAIYMALSSISDAVDKNSERIDAIEQTGDKE